MEHASQTKTSATSKSGCTLCFYIFTNYYHFKAKEYVARHEGALQERFAMSRSTKDLWARFKILLAAVCLLNNKKYSHC